MVVMGMMATVIVAGVSGLLLLLLLLLLVGREVWVGTLVVVEDVSDELRLIGRIHPRAGPAVCPLAVDGGKVGETGGGGWGRETGRRDRQGGPCFPRTRVVRKGLPEPACLAVHRFTPFPSGLRGQDRGEEGRRKVLGGWGGGRAQHRVRVTILRGGVEANDPPRPGISFLFIPNAVRPSFQFTPRRPPDSLSEEQPSQRLSSIPSPPVLLPDLSFQSRPVRGTHQTEMPEKEEKEENDSVRGSKSSQTEKRGKFGEK